MNLNTLHPRDQILRNINRIYQNAMTTTSGGNVSILDRKGRIWITPSRKDKGTLTRDDIVCVEPDGTYAGELPPSSEFPFHKAIYEVRPDIKAIIHAHPPGLVSFSMIGAVPNTKITPKCHRICGEPAFAPYALPGSDELGQSIAQEFAKSPDVRTVILENHGVVVGAGNMDGAFKLFESLDFSARTQIKASALGEVRDIAGHGFEYDRPELKYGLLAHEPNEEELEDRTQMVAFNRRAYQQRLFNSTEGIIAMRQEDGGFLVSPKYTDRIFMEIEDLVYVKEGFMERGKRASDSCPLHEAIFAKNPDINTVIISTPPNAMAFCVTGTPFETRTIPESWILLQDPPMISLDTLYNDSEHVAKLIQDGFPVILVENDSVITVGTSLLEAFDRLEVLEYSAKALIDAQRLGPLKSIGEKEIDDLRTAFLS
ncbi:MAG: class II aldolase/adducin family protein [Opitutales bacterium]